MLVLVGEIPNPTLTIINRDFPVALAGRDEHLEGRPDGCNPRPCGDQHQVATFMCIEWKILAERSGHMDLGTPRKPGQRPGGSTAQTYQNLERAVRVGC